MSLYSTELRRLMDANVEPSSCELATLQSVSQGFFIDKSAACDIDQIGAGPHVGKELATDQTTCLGRQWHVK